MKNVKLKRDLTGLSFGKLRVTERGPQKMYGGQQKVAWNCVCECGSLVHIAGANLTSGATNSCGCTFNRFGPDSPNWTGFKEIPGSYISQARNGAVQRGLSFDVSIEYLWDVYLAQDRKCALSGLDISFYTTRRRDGYANTTASLDRIESSIGYIAGNVQWLHKDVNIMKNNFSEDRFFEICSLVSSGRK